MSRDMKEYCYVEALKETKTNIEMIINHLYHLDDNNDVISEKIVKKDRRKTVLNLELGLASYCVLLRKMHENQFISYNSKTRDDINSIIHSNRFEYTDKEVIVYSQRGREEIHLDQLLSFGQSIINSYEDTF